MIPILYSKQEKTFDTYGLGLLRECTSCIVTEEKNGTYELVLKYPCNGKRYKDLKTGACVKVRTNMGDQIFRIYSITKELNGLAAFRARHISYDLCGYSVGAIRQFNVDPATVIADALEDSAFIPLPFTVESDITSSKPTALLGFVNHIPFSVRALIGAVVTLWDAEVEWDNLTIRIHRRRGRRQDLCIRYGHNMTSFKMNTSTEACYTHMCPFAFTKEGQTVLLDDGRIPLPMADLSVPNVLTIDLTNQYTDGETITPGTLLTKANAYISAHAADLSRPSVSLSVTCTNSKVPVRVCDEVRIIHGPHGVDLYAPVIRTEFNVLTERMERITVGDPRNTLTNYLKGGSA